MTAIGDGAGSGDWITAIGIGAIGDRRPVSTVIPFDSPVARFGGLSNRLYRHS